MTLFSSDFLTRLQHIAGVSCALGDRMLAGPRGRRRTAGIEIAGHRDYTPGDDYRMVDWHICARHDELVSRRIVGEADYHAYILLDCSASMGLGEPSKFDAARQAVATLAYVALANLDRLCVTAFCDRMVADFGPVRDKIRIVRLMRFLEKLTPQPGVTDLAGAAKRFVARHQRHGPVVVVSDLYDPAGFEAGLDVLRRSGYQPRVVKIYDPSESDPKGLGDVELLDLESGSSWPVTLTAKHVEKYRHLFQQHRQAVHSYCGKYTLPCVEIPANLPQDELLRSAIGAGTKATLTRSASEETKH